MSFQPALFSAPAPSFDASFARLRKVDLGEGAWVAYAPGWLQGDDTLFTDLEASAPWRQERRQMYEREVEVPRLVARVADGLNGTVDAMGVALTGRLRRSLRHTSLALYRDGRDSVAFHGDRGDAALPGALTVSVSLGEPRRLLLRRRGGGPSRFFELGRGDLFVMGGTCQQTWEHGVPKVARAGPRLAVLYWMGPASSRPQ